MRLLATGDWQAGVATVSLEDQEAVWHRIVDEAIGRDVDLFLHGGDLVEGPVFTMEQLAAVRRVFRRLQDARIPILVLTGNSRHDLAMRPVHALDLFKDYDGILVSDRPEVYAFGGVSVCTLPWTHPGSLIARTNGSVTHDTINTHMAEALVRIAGGLLEKAGKPALLVAHWAISGAKLPSGIATDEMREPVLPWADLDALGYDLIVGAHIHQRQRLDDPQLDRTQGFVVGSPQQLNFGEHGEHGCWIADVGEHVRAEFVPVESRRFVTLDFTHEDPVAQFAFSAHVGWDVPAGALVRVRMSVGEEQARALDRAAMCQSLIDAGAASVRLDVDVQRETRRRAEISEQLSPVEAMALYCDATGIEEPLRGGLLTLLDEWGQE